VAVELWTWFPVIVRVEQRSDFERNEIFFLFQFFFFFFYFFETFYLSPVLICTRGGARAALST
jgi:hypothetical protein